jgi:hypothetical protein
LRWRGGCCCGAGVLVSTSMASGAGLLSASIEQDQRRAYTTAYTVDYILIVVLYSIAHLLKCITNTGNTILLFQFRQCIEEISTLSLPTNLFNATKCTYRVSPAASHIFYEIRFKSASTMPLHKS